MSLIRAEETLRRIDQMLRIPAAEYVPAISDVFAEIDAYFKRRSAPEPVGRGENKC